MYIETISDFFLEIFPDSWYAVYDLSTDDGLQEAKSQLFSKINEFSQSFFKNLNWSVISGEYISIPNFDSKILELQEKIRLLQRFDQEKVANDNVNSLNSLLELGFIPILIQSLNHYQILFNKCKRQYSVDDKIVLLEAFKNESSEYHTSELKVIRIKSNEFIAFNIKLAIIDHRLSLKKEILHDLVSIKIELSHSSNKSDLIFKILLDKCNFLIKKLLYRFKEDEKNYTYAMDFVDEDLNVENLNPIYFHEFNSLTELHYNIESINAYNYKKEFTKHVFSATTKLKNNEPLLFEDYHCLVKHYKDEDCNKEKLVELLNHFNSSAHNGQSNELRLNIRAFDITQNYIQNNILSFEASESEITFLGLKNNLDKIESLQNSTKVFNYFPYLRTSQALIRLLDSSINEFAKSGNNLNEINSIIAYLVLLEKKLYNNNEWCVIRNFQAFQVPFDECNKDITENDKSYRIFLASSFVLPINYNQVLNEINLVSSAISKYKSKIEFQESIFADKREIVEIRNNVDKSEKRAIEIIGIFAAIVLFVSSNIQIFSKVDSLNQALLFMLVFTYSLSVFILLIWLITRANGIDYKKIPSIHVILISIVALATIVAFGLVLTDYSGSSKSQKSINNLKDSILIKSLKDSLHKGDTKFSKDTAKHVPS